MCICCGGRIGDMYVVQKNKNGDGREGLLR